ncbi:MAG: hypothetical protein NZ528_06475 [Caldilineales bacterium]|nr:hypothetical protein [Caldilineales bacterium]MDW8318151.1 hypothetical protein [Anaerolineae bacterium]
MPASEGKFTLGAIEILPGAQRALQEAGQPAAAYLYKHQYETPDERIGPDSVVSVFTLPTGVVLYVITDEARLHTVLMTADDARR